MSISEIEKDLKLLEQQLEEVETNISDSIERIEHKKQLERKIRKLKRSKSQIEQFEKEQQELKSLKSEFSLNTNESVDKKKSEPDEPAEHIFYITDDYIATESEINLNKQIDNINSEEENSNTTSSVAPSSDNSKESGKAWIIGGTIGFFIFLGMVFNGNEAQQTASNVEQQTSEPVKVEQSSESLSSTQSDRQKNVTQNISQTNSNITQRYPSSSNNKKTIVKRRNTNDSPTKNHQYSQLKYFSNYQFPLASCGDKNPGGVNSWYPVYVASSERNLSLVRNNYCRDAIRKYRTNKQINSIQVASFTDKSKAEEFASLLRINIGSGEVGDSSVHNFDDTSTSSSSDYVFSRNSTRYGKVCTHNYNGRLSLRTGPGQGYRKITEIPNQRKVPLYSGQYADDGFWWWNVNYNGDKGWVRADYVCGDPQ